jgi:hypothetical protein
MKEFANDLVEMQGKICDELCRYRDTADASCICDYMREHDGICPLDTVTNIVRQIGKSNPEQTIKRIKGSIEWCDEVLNREDETAETKKAVKRIAYDQIRKIIAEK